MEGVWGERAGGGSKRGLSQEDLDTGAPVVMPLTGQTWRHEATLAIVGNAHPCNRPSNTVPSEELTKALLCPRHGAEHSPYHLE